jgi:hypothetical protein
MGLSIEYNEVSSIYDLGVLFAAIAVGCEAWGFISPRAIARLMGSNY